MSTDPAQALAQALADLEELARTGARPNRYHARALLLPYGELLLNGGDAAIDDAVDARLQEAATAVGEAWPEAIQAELALACAEHIHSADPRYFDLPNYDWDYTFAARQRLEARLVAADRWDSPCPAHLRTAVERADALLASAGHPMTPPEAPESKTDSDQG